MDGAVGAVAQQPPGVDEVPHHAPLVGKGLREVRARAGLLLLLRTLPPCCPQAYHRVHAELGHVLLALGPRGVHALQRAPQRRRVHVAPRGDAQHDVVPAADAQVQHRGQRVPAGPHVRQQIQAGLPCVATKPRSGSTPSTGSTPSAGHRMGRRKGALPVAPAAHHVRVLVAGRCARLRLKNQRGQLGAPGVLHDAGGHAALQAGGLRALPISVFSLWQSPHSACKVCTLPAKACLTGTTWSSSQAPAVSRSRTARACRPARPGSSASPPRRALPASPSAASGRSRAPPARRWPLYSCPSASHHLRSTSCSRILVPRLSLSPQYCAGLLMATLGTRCGAPSAPGRSCPPGRPASSARAWGRCATRRTLAPPRRRCRGASSRGAAWRRSPRTPPPRSAAAAGARRAACP